MTYADIRCADHDADGHLSGDDSGSLGFTRADCWTAGIGRTTYIFTACGGALGFYLPDYVVGAIKKRRSESIFLGLPDALDLMVVCVEAGLGLDAAMRRVTSELAESCPVICEEFAIAN